MCVIVVVGKGDDRGDWSEQRGRVAIAVDLTMENIQLEAR
jgi:hypothetical protein